MKKKKPKRKLKWEYCECGCKSYTTPSGEFSMFWDLKSKYILRTWHNIVNVEVFGSFEEADAAAYRKHKEAVDELSKDLKPVPRPRQKKSCGYCGNFGMRSPGCPKCGKRRKRTI